MSKPLFRWTVGNCIRQGLEILEESVFRALKMYGEDRFDWMICHNGLSQESRDYLEFIVQNRPIQLVEQTWDDCPIPDVCWSPIRSDGSIEVDGKKCGGTMWKVCPARMRLDVHEIIMDNDIVMLKPLPQIEEFLDSDKTLILEEPIRFYGKKDASDGSPSSPYDAMFPLGENLNSGLMGCPPGYNFADEILTLWDEAGRWKQHSQADEQGLLMATLRNHPNVRIKSNFVREILAKNPNKYRITGEEYALHFVQANRSNNHQLWMQYRDILHDSLKYL